MFPTAQGFEDPPECEGAGRRQSAGGIPRMLFSDEGYHANGIATVCHDDSYKLLLVSFPGSTGMSGGDGNRNFYGTVVRQVL